MKKAIWIIPVVAVISLLIFVTQFGINPRSVPVIKPSYFEEPLDLGVWVYRQLRGRLGKYEVVAIGIDPDNKDHQEVVSSFFHAAKSEDFMVDKIFATVPVTEAIGIRPEFESLPLGLSGEEIFERIKPYKESGSKVLMISLPSESAKSIKNSLSSYLHGPEKMNILTLTLLQIDKEQVKRFRESQVCEGFSLAQVETAEMLKCLFLVKESNFDKEQSETQKKLGGSMDLVGADDYLLFTLREAESASSP